MLLTAYYTDCIRLTANCLLHTSVCGQPLYTVYTLYTLDNYILRVVNCGRHPNYILYTARYMLHATCDMLYATRYMLLTGGRHPGPEGKLGRLLPLRLCLFHEVQ